MTPEWANEKGSKIIGSIIDAWELMPNDQRQVIEDEHASLARNLRMLCRLCDGTGPCPECGQAIISNEHRCPDDMPEGEAWSGGFAPNH